MSKSKTKNFGIDNTLKNSELRNLVFTEAEIKKNIVLSSLENKCKTVLKIYDPNEKIEIIINPGTDDKSREKEVLSCILNSSQYCDNPL